MVFPKRERDSRDGCEDGNVFRLNWVEQHLEDQNEARTATQPTSPRAQEAVGLPSDVTTSFCVVCMVLYLNITEN